MFPILIGAALHPIDVVVLAIFAAGIVAVILVPFTTDMWQSHKTFRMIHTSGADAARKPSEPVGMQGLARATMAFSVIVVIGFALAYILVRRPFSDNRTITSNLVVALTTTLASITAFYFGSKLATQAHRDAAAAAAKGAAAASSGGGGSQSAAPSITITTPADGASYSQNDTINANYTCTAAAGAQIATCDGTVPNGSQLDTSTLGEFTFTVTAVDDAGRTAEATTTYKVVTASG